MPQERTTTDLLASELEELRALVAEQAEAIERLRQRIAGLETRLAKDSHKSSKPPSSDPPFRKPSPRAQRKASGRNRAGQKGHKGITRALLDAPDNLVVTALEGACACGCCRSQIDVERSPERRYGVELVLRPEGTEYRTVAATFACGRRHRSDFPEAVVAPLQ